MNDRRGGVTDEAGGFFARWFSRPRLIALFWTAAVIALAAMVYTGAVGWDAKGYWKAVQSVQHNSDPYAEDIVALQKFHERLATNPAEPRPFVYVYSPLDTSFAASAGVVSRFVRRPALCGCGRGGSGDSAVGGIPDGRRARTALADVCVAGCRFLSRDL